MKRLQKQLQKSAQLDRLLRKRGSADGVYDADAAAADAAQLLERAKRQRQANCDEPRDVSDAALSAAARFTDQWALAPYEPYMQYVPRVVNVVTLAEARAVPGTSTSLPLDLSAIATRCRGAYYAPRRFSAVQLAFTQPRCRVLVFHTGRVVGTGCAGEHEARVALLRAQRSLREDAGIYVTMSAFAVINQVGACALNATLQCDAFAQCHSATAHYDARSFVGLAWRPTSEAICCEVYATGRANLPGSSNMADLLRSWSRMLPELLRFSSAAHLCNGVPSALRDAHRPRAGSAPDAPAAAPSARGDSFFDLPPMRADGADIWSGWN